MIPMFNSEKYLERCLNSVCKALEGASHEILVVDNMSSDSSISAARRYQKTRPEANISVLQCQTPGAGAARNYGLSRAKGEYVWFVDADDEIALNSVSALLARAHEAEADIVMLGMKRLYPDGREDYLSAVRETEADFKSRFVRYGLGPVQVVFRRKWWRAHDFRFMEGRIQEDMELMSALILYTDKFASVDEPLYLYHQNPESVLHKTEFSPAIFDIFPALEGLYRRFEEAEAVSLYHDELEWFFIWNLLIDSAKDFGKFTEGRVGFSRARKMLSSYFPRWRKNRFLRQKSWKLRMRVLINYRRAK